MHLDKLLIAVRPDSYTNAQNEIDAAFAFMNQSLIMAYELGNEPNLYPPIFRPADWNASDYGREMESWIPCLRNRSSAQTAFTFDAFAGPPDFFEDGVTIANMMELGILQRLPGVDYFSTHGYPYDI